MIQPSIPRIPDSDWPKDAIDHFILFKLREQGLEPSPSAGKRALIRRVTFDLTGLPPTSAEIKAFLADPSDSAFETAVNRLLDAPQFGERWGRHWLDVVRYADSNGLESNLPFNNAWRYRDYVVKAFNGDKPFDQFIREQLAGDLLPWSTDEERFEKLTATGFLVLGPKALAEPNPAKLAMDVADEQIDVTTRAFLALTVSCARCHDHKYDPIPTRDYYAMAGIFTSTATLSNGNQRGPAQTRWMERPLATREKAQEIETYQSALNQLLETMRMVRENPGGIRSSKLPGIVVDNTSALLTGRWKESIGSTNYVDQNYVHDANSQKGAMSARFIPNLPHTGDYEVLVSYTPFPNRAANVPVTIHSGDTDHRVFVNQKFDPRFEKAFVSVGTYSFPAGTNGWVEVSNAGTKGFVTADAAQFVPVAEWALELESMANESGASLTGRMTDSKTEETPKQAMAARPMTLALDYYRLQSEHGELLGNAPPPAPMAMAVQDGTIGNTRINIRGDVDRLGPEVPRGFLSALNRDDLHLPSEMNPNDSGRLNLANWIASPQNPLIARVAVNRVWLNLIGKGLVETPDNFGFLGAEPTHPELLDHLARRFVESGWSFKKLIRSIVLSSTYRMSGGHDPRAYALDPDNHLVWRMNRRRLEAEELRDAILAVSGELDLTAGGTLLPLNSAPGAVPRNGFQEISTTRRSLYLPVIRNNVTEMLQVFDFVDPHTIAGKRQTTTAATQALFLLNSGFIIEQSRKWAQSLLEVSAQNDSERVSQAFVTAFGRPPIQEEADRMLAFINGFLDEQPDKFAAWQSFCQALLGSTEFQFLD